MTDALKKAAVSRLILMLATSVATALGMLISASYPEVYVSLCGGLG